MDSHAERIARLVGAHELYGCFECGKCTAVCPLHELFDDLPWNATPRSIVASGLDRLDLTASHGIWYCLQCEACTAGCPCGVGIRDFIVGVRAICLEEERDEHLLRCSSCGLPFAPRTTLEAIERRLGGEGGIPELLLACPRCRTRRFSRLAGVVLGNPPLGTLAGVSK
ncbi:MAG TPA: 4Fe-4S dicluster domain-containing protein [Polyangia bacterium]|nr:4Fe-4S dicluster domain-containing protein [Polyangia bacterium]